ncbi:MAG TPA: hypothetical protein VHX38_02690 [Pseudonocardiaceae bacterium]|jgi:hypothetical protein|nr:hypothetical protein [Pseudonocardiaceae bacterium]
MAAPTIRREDGHDVLVHAEGPDWLAFEFLDGRVSWRRAPAREAP